VINWFLDALFQIGFYFVGDIFLTIENSIEKLKVLNWLGQSKRLITKKFLPVLFFHSNLIIFKLYIILAPFEVGEDGRTEFSILIQIDWSIMEVDIITVLQH